MLRRWTARSLVWQLLSICVALFIVGFALELVALMIFSTLGRGVAATPILIGIALGSASALLFLVTLGVIAVQPRSSDGRQRSTPSRRS